MIAKMWNETNESDSSREQARTFSPRSHHRNLSFSRTGLAVLKTAGSGRRGKLYNVILRGQDPLKWSTAIFSTNLIQQDFGESWTWYIIVQEIRFESI